MFLPAFEYQVKFSLKNVLPKNFVGFCFSTILFLMLVVPTNGLLGQVTGTVFLDFNGNGTKENTATFNEVGYAGITVTGYGADGTTYGPVQTANDGTYTLGGVNQATRIEFTWTETWLFPSVSGGTTVQFVNGASSNIDLGIAYPDDYWDDTNQPIPQILIPCYVNGTFDGGTIGEDAIVQIGNDQNSMAPTKSTAATMGEVGTVWGNARDKRQDRFFFSSLLKRHSGFGAEGIGGMYIMENNGGVYNYAASFDLHGVTPANSATPIDFGNVTRNTTVGDDNYLAMNSATEPSRDLDAFAKIGTMSYGDIDIDNASQRLFAVNMNQRSIIEMDISGTTATLSTASPAALGALVNTYDIMSLSGVPTCANGEFRPWALKVYRGRGYLGAVCDASTTVNGAALRLIVLSFDIDNIAGGFTEELQFPITNFNGWVSTWAQTGLTTSATNGVLNFPQPMLTDIEFNEEGDMVITTANRFGMQMGFFNYIPTSGNTALVQGIAYADIIKACNDGDGTWSIGAMDCPLPMGGNTSEFYDEDDSGDGADESSNGAVAKLMGSQRIVSVSADPFPVGASTPDSEYFASGGINWYSTVDGSKTQAARIFKSNTITITYGKSIGLGDIEFNLNAPPVEIGNFVWNDTDGDGIQDPNEMGISGVTIELLNGTNMVVATAVTNGNGQYIFSSGMGTSTISHRYGLTLNFGENYTLRINNAEGASQQTPLNNLEVTSQNNDGSANGDSRDSDGTDADNSEISFVLGNPGEHNHTYDWGFMPVSMPPTGDCACTEYIYLNEPNVAGSTGGNVHKYAINATTGALTEILGGASQNMPWYPGDNTSELPSPHGLGVDLNGFLYIGESVVDGDPIRKLNCDGNIIATGVFSITTAAQTNIVSNENKLYWNQWRSTTPGDIVQYDLCTGDTEHVILDDGVASSQHDWGLFFDKRTDTFYSTSGYRTADNGEEVFIYTESDFTTGSVNTISPAFSISPQLGGGSNSIMGITTDIGGNIYVVARFDGGSPNGSKVIKYGPAPTYTFLAQSTVDSNSDGSGWNSAAGIVYSEDSGLLYVSSTSPDDDCVSVFDTNLNPLPALAIPSPGDGSNAKGIAINKECCPTQDLMYSVSVCADPNQRIYLQELFNCGDGVICEGTWSNDTNNGNHDFDSCDLGITVVSSGCETYVLEKTGGIQGAQQCPDFRIELEVCIVAPAAMTSTTQGTCAGAGPNNDATINLTSVTGDEAGIIAGADYTGGPAYGSGNLDVSSGSGIFMNLMHNTQYTIRVFNGANDCFVDYTITSPTITCFTCPTITNPAADVTICEGQTITTLSINTDATNPDQIEFVYFNTQQAGSAMYTGGTSLGLVSPNAGSANISNVGFPTTGVYYVYAILSPVPTEMTCRPFQEMIVTVNPIPGLSLMVNAPIICDGEDASVVISASEIGVIYQLRDDTNDSPVGAAVAGTGGDLTINVTGLNPGSNTFNVLASNGTTGCQGELTGNVIVTVNNCDFSDFPPPVCVIPACHIIPATPLVYFGAGVTADPPGNGDLNADTDVDDGIGFPNNIRRNSDIRLPITFFNNTGNPVYIQGWIDWDGDTNFDADEQVANLTISYDFMNQTQTISHSVSVPADAVQDSAIAMRWRISSDPIIIGAPCGVAVCAADGEVEDYLIQIECPEEVCLPTAISIIRN